KHAAPFAVAPLDRRDDDVERRQRPLELEPGEAAPAWRVRAQRCFDHQAFVAALAGLGKKAVEVLWVGGLFETCEQEWMVEAQGLEQLAPLGQRRRLRR